MLFFFFHNHCQFGRRLTEEVWGDWDIVFVCFLLKAEGAYKGERR